MPKAQQRLLVFNRGVFHGSVERLAVWDVISDFKTFPIRTIELPIATPVTIDRLRVPSLSQTLPLVITGIIRLAVHCPGSARPHDRAVVLERQL